MENSENPHIGNIIKQELCEQERSVAWLARQIHIDDSHLRKMLKKNSNIHTDLLLRISQILHYDFFTHYSHILSSKAGL